MCDESNKKPFPFQISSVCPRNLTEEEKFKLEKDKNFISEFKQNKLENEAQKNWDLFYKRNTTKFFKDRHWTKREFSDLFYEEDEQTKDCKTILEVGCGVGNFLFPLLKEFKKLYFYACDFSIRAVQFVKENSLYNPDRCHAFQCDITCDDLSKEIPPDTVDAVSMIFVLSAIHPDKMVTALKNISKILKPGGCILFRDYGLYDHAMLRFGPGHKLCENFYVRQDGTRAYYFKTDELTLLMESAGYNCANCEYIQRETVNKKEGLCVPRIFVQAKFIKSIADKVNSSQPIEVNKTDECTNGDKQEENITSKEEGNNTDIQVPVVLDNCCYAQVTSEVIKS
ncbi:tRNA N(3)-methylcytidine methyltransferase METTL6-like [Mytilus californianus]|uniref:tRNA N(3)-methylcytidine methyltransferase METTL6-like n=1 Tax=Mytilus californianus TaxID=6549 RepID=UPI0022468A54|nr:tRNA N(3)-methylcytidine methyltransferase METTL6-like [Mytilus californianus]